MQVRAKKMDGTEGRWGQRWIGATHEQLLGEQRRVQAGLRGGVVPDGDVFDTLRLSLHHGAIRVRNAQRPESLAKPVVFRRTGRRIGM